MGSALRCLIRRHSNLTWGQGRQNNKSSLCSLLKNKACRLHMYHAHTNKLMKQCLEQWNLFGWTTKTSLRLDAWQALISSLPLCLPLFLSLLLSSPLCMQVHSPTELHADSCQWEDMDVWWAQIPSLFPVAHFHPTPSRKHQGPLQSRHEGKKRKQ